MNKYLCIDVGGTNIKYSIIKKDGTFLQQGKEPTTRICRHDLDAFVNRIYDLYNRFKPVEGIALSMPGIIDIKNNIMISGGSIVCCKKINLINQLHKLIPENIPITIENDGKAACLAEKESGVFKSIDNGIFIGVGTGLAGAIMIDHNIIRGSNLFAGEFSSTIYTVQEPLIMDDYHNAARQCTPANIRKLYKQYSNSAEEISTELIIQYAKQNDQAALKAIKETVSMLAMIICNLQCAIDPQLFAIGGGISEEPLFIELLQQQVTQISQTLWNGVVIPDVVSSKYHNNANLIGALYFHLNTTNRY